MNRIPLRQVARHLRRTLTPLSGPQLHQPARGFGSRWMVPRLRHPFWHEDVFGMSRMMERQLRNMEMMMEEMSASRGWLAWEPRLTVSPGIKVTHNEKVFEVAVDVGHFAKSGDLELKTTGNRLIISAKNTEKTDSMGSLYSQLHREINIPKDVLRDTLEANMTEEGHLVVRAKVNPQEKPEEKIIEIQRGKNDKESQ